MRIEQTILANLIGNEEYTRKIIPFLDKSYFQDKTEKILVDEIILFFNEYNKLPTKEILAIALSNRTDLRDDSHIEAQDYLKVLTVDSNTDKDWLFGNTEQFVKDKALYNGILESIGIIEGKDLKLSKDAIPNILQKALGISFDTKIGHDYFENAEERWEYYHAVDGVRIPFRLDIFNKITKGGLKCKTLTAVAAATGGGKSIFMCDFAAATLLQGKNVLYITMEMPEEEISARIDANLMNIVMDEVELIDKVSFMNKINKIKDKTNGKLIVKEYPSGSVHAGHFRAFIQELKQKKGFKADVIIIDYLGICSSQRMKMSVGVNTNSYMKSIASELRALAQEENVPIVTGVQLNREGQTSTDIDITNIAESIGITNELDLFFGIINTDELTLLNQVLIKQFKNRYNDVNYYKKFVIGIERSKMKFYDVENSAQDDISEKGTHDIPMFDKSTGGNFDGFKF